MIRRTDEVYKRLRFSAMKSSRLKSSTSGLTSSDALDVDAEAAAPAGEALDATMKELMEGTFDDVDENLIKEIEQEEARLKLLHSGDGHFVGDFSGVSAVLAQAGVKVCRHVSVAAAAVSRSLI